MPADKIPFSHSFSLYGVPLLGIGSLLLCLWHPQAVRPSQTQNQEMMMILDTPNPKHNKIMAAFLSQEAKNVAHCRQMNQPTALAQAIDGYNLIAQECTPTVFDITHLPPAM